MSPFRSPIALAALFFLLILVARGFGAPPWWGGIWILPRLLFPLLLVAAVVFLTRSRSAWRDQRRAYASGPTPAYVGSTPEEILRERFARGELSREQYRESIVEMLKDRYVRDELTLEEYEARVDAVMDMTPPPAREAEANELA